MKNIIKLLLSGLMVTNMHATIRVNNSLSSPGQLPVTITPMSGPSDALLIDSGASINTQPHINTVKTVEIRQWGKPVEMIQVNNKSRIYSGVNLAVTYQPGSGTKPGWIKIQDKKK